MATLREQMPRPLTLDEQKAAEAAFHQRPFNEDWSAHARGVYDGIRKAMRKLNGEPEEARALQVYTGMEERRELVSVLARMACDEEG